ncbi:serine/threonine protein kinase [Cohnella sp. CBP 2801]|uniref:non-specific serine/threonine protein kinase n=1 Tax=Cohnella zeiphila TaxID=2761120 RepID=A0A7X0VYW1_9BACL|nr:serine/threonine protein kinase [Cohnella zeiphila]
MPPGTILRGKWNGRTYRLERLLGAGSNGQVYLASSGRAACAVKIGNEPAELQAEANALMSLDRRERKRPPFLLDVDDAALQGRDVPFYAMQYVPGASVRSYLRRHGAQWFGVIGYRLLRRLAELHDSGLVFGDLKNDNVLVTDYGRLALVDYGGMTAAGRSVRQFTEIYDRGYWGAGSRTADPAYDWFAAAVLWIHVLDGKRLMSLTRTVLPQNRSPEDLMTLVRTHTALKPMESWFEKAIHGRFADSNEACDVWRACLHRTEDVPAAKIPGWITGLFVFSVALCVSAAAYLLLQL